MSASLFFWFFTAAMGFGTRLVLVLQVKATSPLSHCVSLTAREEAQAILLGARDTSLGVFGSLMALTASALYCGLNMKASSSASKNL